MAQAQRHSNLFAAEDFRTIYRSFSEINFTAYDFDTIKQSMVEYLVRNFPEEFNDFIESSEFIAIIELLAYMGQTIAFRQDLNTRENFLDTAERDESILRLAKMLNYVPKRNLPGAGLLKLYSIRTTEEIFDSNGKDISNQTLIWNDVNNADYLEQILLVLNAAFINQNSFGTPVAKGTISGVDTELYHFNNVKSVKIVYPIQANVNSVSVPFEVVNVTFDDGLFFKEVEPNPDSSFGIVYLNDGLGNSSNNTGFFTYVKQGQLKFEDFDIQVPLPNREINIAQENINNLDVWVQTINSAGTVLDTWEKVPAVSGHNVVYNSIARGTRKIFAVNSDTEGTISLNFADGEFGDVPYGTLRVWYRQSHSVSVNVKPEHIGTQSIQVSYLDKNSIKQTLSVALQLESNISNNAPAETNAEIKTNASQVFYTQDRMITGEDYNIYPAFKNANIVKIKSLNRTHAGHSRYIDINDPTGTLQNLNVFAEDGIIFKDEQNNQTTFKLTSSLTPNTIIMNYIQPQLSLDELTNFYYDMYRKEVQIVDGNAAWKLIASEELEWVTMPDAKQSNKGYLILNGADAVSANSISIGAVATGKYAYLIEKCLLEFKDPTGEIIKFATAENIINNGDPIGLATGPVELNVEIPRGYTLARFYPRFKRLFNTAEKTEIYTQLNLKNTFGIGFDYKLGGFYVIAPNNLDLTSTNFSLSNQKDNTSSNKDNSWIIKAEYNEATDTTDASYVITTRGLRYVFESEEEVRFYFNNAFKTIDIKTGQAQKDSITILKVNLDKRAEIERVAVTSPGYGYITAPTVTFNFPGEVEPAEGVASLSWNTIIGGTGGSGYQPTTSGINYLDSNVVDADGKQTEIVINNLGVLSSTGRSVQLRANLSDAATGTLNITTGSVGTIVLTTDGTHLVQGGSGYTATPSVTLSAPPSGITATATAIVSSQVSGTSLVAPTYAGGGYQNIPSLYISPPGFSGQVWTVAHGLGQKFVNFEIINTSHNVVNTVYDAPTVTYLDANTLRVVWPAVVGSQTGFMDIIKSQFISPLHSSANEWVFNHGLTGTDGLVTVEVIYDNDNAAQGGLSYPLIEYSSETVCTVRFPSGVLASGYIVATNKFGESGTVGSAYTGTFTTSEVSTGVWQATITHNLGKQDLNVDVAVLGSEINSAIYDTAATPSLYYNIKGNYDFPTINFIDGNQLTLTFLATATATGKVIISGGDLFGNQIQAAGVVHMEVGDDSTASTSCEPITVVNGGSGYNIGDQIRLNGTSTTTSHCTFTVATVNSGVVLTGTVLTGGDYTEALGLDGPIACPTTTITGTGDNQLTVSLNYKVKEVEVTNVGDGYQTAPIITLGSRTGTCGTGADATVSSAVNGKVTAINIDNPGSGYTVEPTVTIDLSSTTLEADRAIGTSVLSSSVSTVTIIASGESYNSSSPPAVTFPVPSNPPAGVIAVTATGTAIVSVGGNVTGVTVDNGGVGYTVADASAAVIIGASGEIMSIDITDTGFGYSGQPVLTYATTAGGVGATTLAVQGFVSNVEMSDAGQGYTDATSVVFSTPTGSGGVNATGAPILRTNKSLESDIKFNLSDLLTYEDGYQDPRKALITFVDSNNDGTPDDPLSFDRFVDTTRYIFQETFTDFDGYVYYKLSKDVLQAVNQLEENIILVSGADYNGKYIYRSDLEVFKKISLLGSSYIATTLSNNNADGDKKFSAFIGRSGYQTPIINSADETVTAQTEENIFFQWKHYAPVDQRIDPSITNLIDVFVLTLAYYNNVVSWKSNNKDITEFPETPSSSELAILLADLNDFKSISDEIIYRPVRFKILFGSNAIPELRANFKIVKMVGSNLSDNELRSLVVQAVNDFFNIANWDMGESFYYTELAAYIHQTMPTHLSSIVVVPTQTESNFGNLFQVKADPDELFLSTAQVSDVEVVKGFTEQNLKVK